MAYSVNTNDNGDCWALRVANACKWYEVWESKFKCRSLEDYYEGNQWKLKRDSLNPAYNPYTLNMVYSTIKQKLATLLFQRPQFNLTPTPGTSQYDLDFAVTQTYLKQDVLNTIISNPNTDFTNNLRLSALDSFFRFGVMEVGYAADWRNPQKNPLEMASYTNPDIKKDRVVEQNEVPQNERIYVKRINPKRFRCSVSDATDLNDQNWVGYYEWILTSELKGTPGIKWPQDGGASAFSSDYVNDISFSSMTGNGDRADFLRYAEAGKVSKVWHIWDMVCHKRLLLLEDANFAELWSDDFDELPIVDLRWDYRTEGFYPIPPIFQWLSPQDEINEAREQARSFRRRFTRKFQMLEGAALEDEEAVKFASGPDGVIIRVKQMDAIKPIQNPELPNVNISELQNSRDDFSIVSGSSAEARGQVADRETATQATLTQQRAQIRESADQMDYSNFICLVGRKILIMAQTRLDNGMWVKYTSDPNENALQDVQSKGPAYKWVHAQDLADGYDFTIDIDVMNNTPQMAAQAMQSFSNFLAFVKTYPEIAMSPVLIREAAYRSGYRNERVIHQMQQVALASMAAKAQQQSLAGGQTLQQKLGSAPGANSANTATSTLASQMALPSQQGISDQLSNQVK